MNLEEFVIRLRDQFSSGIHNARKETQGLRNDVEKTNSGIGSLAKTAVKAFAAFQSYRAISGVVRLGAEMEQTRVAFRTFLGDAELANKTIAELDQFANVTPFANDEVLKAGKALLAFGTPVQQLQTDMRAIGDISSGTGKNFNELAVIYGKARVAGTLYAEDINQLIEAGVPVISQFAKQLGVSESQVKKLASEGKIGFGNLEKAFQTMTGEGGMFFKLMDAQSKTFGGQVSTLKGQLQVAGVAIGEALLPVLTPIVEKLGEFTTWAAANKETLATWVPIIAKVAAGIGALLIVTRAYAIAVELFAGGGLLMKVIGLFVTLGASVLGMQAPMWAATSSTWALNAALSANPIGLIIIGVSALIALVVQIIRKWDEWGETVVLFLGPIGLVISAIQSLRRNWENIKKAFSGDGIVAGIKMIGKTLLDAVLSPIQKILEVAGDWLGLDWASNAAASLESYRKSLGVVTGLQGDVAKTFGGEGGPAGIANAFSILESPGAKGGTGGTIPTGGIGGPGKSSGLGAGISEIKSSAPKVFNINIDSLIQQLTIQTSNLTESSTKIKEEITKALLSAVNDSQIQAG